MNTTYSKLPYLSPIIALALVGCTAVSEAIKEQQEAGQRYENNLNRDKDSGLIGVWSGNVRGRSDLQVRIELYEYMSIQEQFHQNGRLVIFRKGTWNLNPSNKNELFNTTRPYPQTAGPSITKIYRIEKKSPNQLTLSLPQEFSDTGTSDRYHAGYGTYQGTGTYIKEAQGDNRRIYVDLQKIE